MKLNIIKKWQTNYYWSIECTDSKWEAWCKNVALNYETWWSKKRSDEPASWLNTRYQRKYPIYDFKDVLQRWEISPQHVKDFISFTYTI